MERYTVVSKQKKLKIDLPSRACVNKRNQMACSDSHAHKMVDLILSLFTNWLDKIKVMPPPWSYTLTVAPKGTVDA